MDCRPSEIMKKEEVHLILLDYYDAESGWDPGYA